MRYVVEGWYVDGGTQLRIPRGETLPHAANVWRVSVAKNASGDLVEAGEHIADFSDEDRAHSYVAWLEASEAAPAITAEQASEALDSLDDFTRMANVDAHGPRGLLERFILQSKTGVAPRPGFLVYVQVMEESHRTTYWTTIERADRPKNAAPWEPGRVHPFLSEHREHAEHEAAEWAELLGVEYLRGDVRPVPKDQSDDMLTALSTVRAAITEYHLALDSRQHGGVAAGRVVDVIQAALNMPWIAGEALKASQA